MGQGRGVRDGNCSGDREEPFLPISLYEEPRFLNLCASGICVGGVELGAVRAYGFIMCFCKWYLGHSEPFCYRSLREGKGDRMMLSNGFFFIKRGDTVHSIHSNEDW